MKYKLIHEKGEDGEWWTLQYGDAVLGAFFNEDFAKQILNILNTNK